MITEEPSDGQVVLDRYSVAHQRLGALWFQAQASNSQIPGVAWSGLVLAGGPLELLVPLAAPIPDAIERTARLIHVAYESTAAEALRVPDFRQTAWQDALSTRRRHMKAIAEQLIQVGIITPWRPRG